MTCATPDARIGVPLVLILLLLAAGCGSAVSQGQNTALNGDELVKMTDQMAAAISASPAIAQAIGREGKLNIVVLPVENDLVGEVLPRGEEEAFTARVRILLAQHAPDRFAWIMNRDAYEDLRRRELNVDLGPSPDAINPNYALSATFSSITQENSQRRTEYYLCVYELTDLRSRAVLWSGKYELKKTAVKGFLD
jgi:hypothetical protein